jgi:HSP20 family molecular chaperone IbpA
MCAEVTVPSTFAKDDVDMNIDGDLLTITARKGDKRDDEGEDQGVKYRRHAEQRSECMRSMRLPVGVKADQLRARWRDAGTLVLDMPRDEKAGVNKHRVQIEDE